MEAMWKLYWAILAIEEHLAPRMGHCGAMFIPGRGPAQWKVLEAESGRAHIFWGQPGPSWAILGRSHAMNDMASYAHGVPFWDRIQDTAKYGIFFRFPLSC